MSACDFPAKTGRQRYVLLNLDEFVEGEKMGRTITVDGGDGEEVSSVLNEPK